MVCVQVHLQFLRQRYGRLNHVCQRVSLVALIRPFDLIGKQITLINAYVRHILPVDKRLSSFNLNPRRTARDALATVAEYTVFICKMTTRIAAAQLDSEAMILVSATGSLSLLLILFRRTLTLRCELSKHPGM